jgi:hypothetical protein
MAHIDTIFTIKQLYANLFINKPFLKRQGIDSPESFCNALPKTSFPKKSTSSPNLTDILTDAFDSCEDRTKVGRYQKYQDFHELLLTHLRENSHETIPLFVSGESITDTMNPKKKGIDPYASHHLFSGLLLDELSTYPIAFTQQFRFLPIQPVTYIQKSIETSTGLSLQDVMKPHVDTIQTTGVGFGTLERAIESSGEQGNSYYSDVLLSAKKAIAEIEPDDPEYITKKKKAQMTVYLNQQILALKYASIVDILAQESIPILKSYRLNGFPVYMEKTSPSAQVIKRIDSYSKVPFKTYPVGGVDGILMNTPERMPVQGICHPSALNRLSGFFQSLYQKIEPEASRSFQRYERRQNPHAFSYISAEQHPFLLIPDLCEDRELNIEQVFEKTLSETEQRLIKNFAYKNKIGFTRLEPRLLTLFTQDQIVYTGFRNMDKQNRFWKNEIQGKRILPPSEIDGFFSMDAIREDKADFRGSLLSLPTTPRITQEWLNDAHQGNLDVGCSIEKLIASSEHKTDLLKRYLPDAPLEMQKDFWNTHLATYESIPAVRGTAIHTLSTVPFEGLAEYDMTEPLGFSISPDNYAEFPIHYSIDADRTETNKGFSISMHPDALFFLEHDNKYDILIIDTKTNRVTPYPEHKYILQTFTYAWVIKQLMQEQLGKEIDSTYTVLNKNAFYKNFGDIACDDTEDILPHHTYRPQVFSPITRFENTNPLHSLIIPYFETIRDEQDHIVTDPSYSSSYKRRAEQKNRCKKCYTEHKIICDRLHNDQSFETLKD